MRTLLTCLLLVPALASSAPEVRLTLKDAESLALKNSPSLAAAQEELDASRDSVKAQKSYLYPTLTLDGSYRWVDEVPSMQMAPSRVIQFGDHRSNTVGVGASWQVWDWGAARQAYRSVQAQTESRRQSLRGSERQTLFNLRLGYFQVQATLEQSRLIADSLKLAQAQYRDIGARYKAGTASRADALAAHQEVLSWMRQLRTVRGDIAASLRDLYASMGMDPPADLSLPLDSRTAASPPADIHPPSAVVLLDPLDGSASALKDAGAPAPDATLPQPALFDALAQSARLQSKAQKAGLFPRFQITARASYDYPNGPVLETIQQNMVGISASMPLFDWGRTNSQVKAAQSQADAYEKKRDQAVLDLKRDWGKAVDLLRSLEDQQAFNHQSVEESKELVSLIYESYKTGRSSFLEVQSANLRAQQVAVLSARTDVQVLIQRALLSALSKED